MVRNPDGETVDGVSLRHSASSRIEAEAKAASKAFESGESAKNCGNLKSFSWSTIPKEANEAAKELCKKVVQLHDEVTIDWLRPPLSWVVDPPDWLNFLIAKEMPESN
ncbi:hypothetical protein M0R45_033618 [Rubus argutus]|uniref:RNase H type-1 domain-containing protein n=1 Tax=Rubus argutus TaxID=59490 RepID=A0AAW1WPS5_RUBAR